MIVKYDRSFEKDIYKLKDAKLLELIYTILNDLKIKVLINFVANENN